MQKKKKKTGSLIPEIHHKLSTPNLLCYKTGSPTPQINPVKAKPNKEMIDTAATVWGQEQNKYCGIRIPTNRILETFEYSNF